MNQKTTHTYTCTCLCIRCIRRYYYCARPSSSGSSHEVRFETGGIYTIVLGEENAGEVSTEVVRQYHMSELHDAGSTM